VSTHSPMSRPATIEDDDLIEAARTVFVSKGMNATTAEIARQAGVSEGTLFKRFKSKWELFHAVMKHMDGVGKRWTGSLAGRVGKGELRDQLEAIASEGIDFFRLLVPHHMMSGSSPEHTEIAKKEWGNSHPALESRRAFEAYFEGERKAGRIGPMDAEVLARTFIGSLYNFVVMEILTGPLESQPMSQSRFVRLYVDLLLRGAAPPAAVPKTRRPSR
jgi:AcrR family transcriptional regulator